MYADFDYYTSSFKGTKIKDAHEYQYLAQQADLYIAKATSVVDNDTKACECAISEYLQGSLKQGNMTSENIPNYYSVTWGSNDRQAKQREINAIMELYLGNKYSAVGAVKVIG